MEGSTPRILQASTVLENSRNPLKRFRAGEPDREALVLPRSEAASCHRPARCLDSPHTLPCFHCTWYFSRRSAAGPWGAPSRDPTCMGWGACRVSVSPELRCHSTWWHPPQRVSLPAVAPCRQGLCHPSAPVCGGIVYTVVSYPTPHPTPPALPQDVSGKQRHHVLVYGKHRWATPPSLRVPICCPARGNYNCFVRALLHRQHFVSERSTESKWPQK